MKSTRVGLFLFVLVMVAASSCQRNKAGSGNNLTSDPSMDSDHDKLNNEATIRALITTFQKAFGSKDIQGILSVFDPAVVSFDLGPPLQHGGGEVFEKRWQELFEASDNISIEVTDLSTTAGDNVSFSHSLNRISGTMKNGAKFDRWLRWTACYQKSNGKWLIVHEHVSVPVDVIKAKAILDLKP